LTSLPTPTGERSTFSDVLGVGKLVKELVEAGIAIWNRIGEADKLRRQAIRTQLEATRWPEFGKIPPIT
jgi:hypothetical protein